MSSSPIVSVVLAARDAERFVRQAVHSILRQSLRDLELIVIDDGSTDSTPQLLAGVADPRLVVVRNDEPTGLAAALNRGFAEARGTYVARMDADDVALPRRLERQVARLRSRPLVAVAGCSVTELSATGKLGRTHILPSGVLATRWRTLFGTPFFHPTVILDRALIERYGLRYDAAYDAGDASTEDYELWSRLLDLADGDNLAQPLLLYRRHEGQASERRAAHQLELRRTIALRRITAMAPELSPSAAELAWLVGDSQELPVERADEAVEAHIALLAAFSRQHVGGRRELPTVRELAAREIARVALRTEGATRAQLLRKAAGLDPTLAAHAAARVLRRRTRAAAVRSEARPWLEELAVPGARQAPADAPPVRVAVVSPEPTPFRSLLFDRLSQRRELDFQVIYSGRTIFGRTWTIEHRHPHVFLRGVRIPGVRRVFRHEYPVTLGILAALAASRPDVIVVSGWSTFASQVAVLWCRVRRIPYVLLVESNDRDPRPGWRSMVKSAVVPPIVRGAARVLVIGRLARESALARGARPERLAWFANTIDVETWFELTDQLAPRRPELRRALGIGEGDVAVLSVARLAPEKGLDTLVRAVAELGDPRVVLAVVGEGRERAALERLARQLDVRLLLVGDIPWERVVETYVAADVFALLSEHEPWGVVVNEAAACGLPLILSDRVGAAYDLLVEGENGAMVPCGDVAASAAALRPLVADPAGRLAAGARSRVVMQNWGYGPSIENFVAAVRDAIASA